MQNSAFLHDYVRKTERHAAFPRASTAVLRKTDAFASAATVLPKTDAFACASAAVLPTTDAFACGAAVEVSTAPPPKALAPPTVRGGTVRHCLCPVTSTAVRGEDTAFALCFHLPSWLRHCPLSLRSPGCTAAAGGPEESGAEGGGVGGGAGAGASLPFIDVPLPFTAFHRLSLAFRCLPLMLH